MDWIKNNFKQAILIALLTVVLSTVGSIIVYSVTNHEDRLQRAAPIEYVDKKCEDTRIYIDKQDGLLNERLGRVQESLNTKADQSDYDKLYQKTEENNRILIDIALKMGIK